MIKYPISFKGPKGQLQTHLSEALVYQALTLMMREEWIQWRHDEVSQLVRAKLNDGTEEVHCQLHWPLESQLVAKCSCAIPKPCVHICALVIESKSRLDQLPPFTQQLKKSSDVRMAFFHWLQRQSHDPFPPMARHRVAYLLNYDESVGQYVVSLHKAYLNQDDSYQIKAEIDSGLLLKKVRPKFLSLADQQIMHMMHKAGATGAHEYLLSSAKDKPLFKAMVGTGRCFWRACYRPPLTWQDNHPAAHIQASQSALDAMLQGVWFHKGNNAIVEKVAAQTKRFIAIDVKRATTMQAHLAVISHSMTLEWAPQTAMTLDVAQISFSVGEVSFNLEDLRQGLVPADEQLLDAVAGYCIQLEKLPSVHAAYEAPVAERFSVNDRCLQPDLTSHAPLLLALKRAGWHVDFDATFRNNQVTSDKWFANIQSDADTPWFDLALGVEIDGKPVNLLPHLVKAIKTGALETAAEQLSIQLDDGQWIGVEHKKVKHIAATLSELYDLSTKAPSDSLKLQDSQLLRLNQLEQVWQDSPENLQWQGDLWLKDKADALKSVNELPEVAVPGGLNATLRAYQVSGLSWLQFLVQHDLGGILADDMGLGKTLQTLAHILTEKQSGRMTTPCLVVTPTSLVGNWQSECAKFTPQLSVLALMGQNRAPLHKKIKQADVVLTSYGTLSRDVEKLRQHDFHLLVLDEAQAIKNSKTRISRTVKQVPSKHRLCLTGTPIENHLGELWSMFEFLMPGFLGSQKQFQNVYQWPIEKAGDEMKQKALQARVAPLMMRRKKEQVATELPDKTEVVELIELEEMQAAVYESVRLSMADEIRQAVHNKSGHSLLIGNALLRLRQVCCHPALLGLSNDQNSSQDQTESKETQAGSGKLAWLRTVLPTLIEDGRRILIFSSFTSMLKIIADELSALEVDYLKLTGKTPAAKRSGLVDEFQQGNVPVFLISLKAGGAGLNLTAADTVIHFDPWWNPAAEKQASDRAHRIGQDKQVFVYKLIARGTVEQKINDMQNNKKLLADSVLNHNKTMTDILGEQQWESVFEPLGG
ncbi:SNF2-related protein [Marinicella rhabdoformis]|uniref:SNF2-related protein n=1 Tax=Marinicella rhabdoformis TaxID=2580566 RepID=UPI0012AECDE0